MAKDTFRWGEIIIFDGLYACGAEECQTRAWGVSGRRFPRPPCGHGDWRLLRRRIDHWW